MRIWFPRPLGDDVIAELRTVLPGHWISQEFLPDADVLIEGRPEREQLVACSELKRVIVPFAGISPSLLELMRDFPHVTLHNLHHNARDTAETAIALLMAAAKRTVEMDQALRRFDWTPRYEPEKTELLAGKTAVILGYGEIGSRIAKILRAMEMRVIGIRRSHHAFEQEDVKLISELADVLPQADVLIVTVPHTPETHGLIGAREIGLLPQGAILINVARAQIVDEQAFYDGLKSGKLHSAGSDVWYRYPAEEGTAVPTLFVAPPSAKNTSPTNLPFHELPNMIFSPHRGGATRQTESRRVQALAKLIRTAAAGNEMPNKVDLGAGY